MSPRFRAYIWRIQSNPSTVQRSSGGWSQTQVIVASAANGIMTDPRNARDRRYRIAARGRGGQTKTGTTLRGSCWCQAQSPRPGAAPSENPRDETLVPDMVRTSERSGTGRAQRRIERSERVSLWGMAGYGEGTLTLAPDGAAPRRPDLSFRMGAVGARGVLAGKDGASVLALKSDALAVRTSTGAVSDPEGGNLAAAEGQATRLRLALEGALPVRLGESAVLTPSVELGVRHDGGDAETGFGADIGAGIALSDPARGLSADIRARGLLTHEADGLGERGLSGTLSFDPAPETERGLSLILTQAVGGATWGGADALLGRTTLAGLGAEDGGGLDARRLDARIGYGFGVFEDRYTAIPELGLGLTNTGRELRLGWRLAEWVFAGVAFEVGVEGTRREAAGGDADPEHGITVDAGWRLAGSDAGSFEVRVEAARRDAANDDAPPEHTIGARLGVRW